MAFPAAGPSRVGSPPSFKLDLSPPSATAPSNLLRFDRPAAEAAKPARQAARAYTFNVTPTFARLIFVSQCLMVFILVMLVGGLMYTANRMHANALWAYASASPYLEELQLHGMHILHSTDSATAHVDALTGAAETAASETIPALARTANATAEAVAHMARMAAHPTLKVSVE